MLPNRIFIRNLMNQGRLLNLKPKLISVQSIRKGHDKWDDPHPPLMYRDIGDFQDTSDWIGTCILVGFAICFSSINVYMNWEEYKLEDPPGFNYDTKRFKDEELGIPKSDDLGYAPLRKDLVESGILLDLGNKIRNERRFVYHWSTVKTNQPSPFDV